MASRRKVLQYVAALVGWIASIAHGKEKMTGNQRRPENVVPVPPVDWSVLTEWRDRKITLIELSLDAKFNDNLTPSISMSFEVTGVEALRRFQVDAPYSFLRLAFPGPDDYQGGAGAGANLGRLRIKTTEGTLSVLITAAGFALEAEHAEFQRLFFSFQYAYLIDDLYLRKTGSHLPYKMLSQLSGEAWIEQQKTMFFGFGKDGPLRKRTQPEK